MGCVSPMVLQIWVVFTILNTMVGQGMLVGITSSMLLELQAPESSVKMDLEQASWLSAVIGVGGLVSMIAITYIMAIYGRRGAMIAGILPAIIGSLICYYFSNVNVLIFGRFLSGVGTGIGIIAAVIIAEYTTPKYRGVFLNLKSAALYFGSTIVHILGNYLDWRTVSIIIAVLYTVTLVMTYTWPESPAWLASQKNFHKCEKYFYLLRGESEQSTRELVAMISAQKEQPLEADKTILKDIIFFIKKFTKMNFLKPVIVYFFVAILLEVSGRYTIPAYALSIIYELDPNHSNAFYYNLGVDLLMSISAIISSFLVKLMKRRTLLFSSGVSTVIILLAFSLYNYLQTISYVSQKYNFVAIFLFALSVGVVNLGCIPICLSLVGEIFPLEHRPTGTSVSGLFICFFSIVTLKATPHMLDTIKICGTFTVYAISMAVCMLILYFILPETKDKTLQDIEEYFYPKQNERVEEEQVRFINIRRQ